VVLIVGHRGARDLWPENGLDGFRRTRELGVDAVELDVHLARDGEPVVIHDPTLERTTEGSGAVAERSAAELASTRLRGGNGEGVPLLDEVLDLFAGSPIELQIEIKPDLLGRNYQGIERLLVERLARRGLGETAVLTCFLPEVLESVRRIAPRHRVLGSLDRRAAWHMGGAERALERFAAIEGCIVAVERDLLELTLEASLRRLGGERLGVWVPNDAQTLGRWLREPIRQITTDRPDIALELRRRAAR
jgi:glycerophosphoryl diester phosphodiesterase